MFTSLMWQFIILYVHICFNRMVPVYGISRINLTGNGVTTNAVDDDDDDDYEEFDDVSHKTYASLI